MRKIERRAMVCLLLAFCLFAGLILYCFRFATQGSEWVTFTANRHVYAQTGELVTGQILDRDGDVLSTVEDGKRVFYDDATVRKATLHAVGDREGNIGTGALTAFSDLITGYNPVTGSYTASETGNDITLTIDAYLNVKAYQALDGRKGAVAVYNYQTGEIVCMVSTPTFDPNDPPVIEEGDTAMEGAYINRVLSATFTPGSVFKTITLAAALENIDDLHERTWTCTGEHAVGGVTVTCPSVHGDLDIDSAYANSCNYVFASLAAEIGGNTMQKYVNAIGLTDRYSIDGIKTAKGSFTLSGADKGTVGWAGVGQADDLVNPCAMMVAMGAIANGGETAEPHLLLDSKTAMVGPLFQADTAATLRQMMRNNVVQTYGADRFPEGTCAKSGTAEVGGDADPHAWFTGFLDDPEHPYAFTVMVQNGGSGNRVAGAVAAEVLEALVDKF